MTKMVRNGLGTKWPGYEMTGYPTSDVTYDVGTPTVYRRIWRKFLTLSNQMSRYIRKCIRMVHDTDGKHSLESSHNFEESQVHDVMTSWRSQTWTSVLLHLSKREEWCYCHLYRSMVVMDVKIPVELQTVKLSDIANNVRDGQNAFKEKTETGNVAKKHTTVTNDENRAACEDKLKDVPKLFYKTQVNGERKLVFVRPNVPVLSEKISAKVPQQQMTLLTSTQLPAYVPKQENRSSQGVQQSTITDTSGKTTKLVFSFKREPTESSTQKEPHKSTLLPGKFTGFYIRINKWINNIT